MTDDQNLSLGGDTSPVSALRALAERNGWPVLSIKESLDGISVRLATDVSLLLTLTGDKAYPLRVSLHVLCPERHTNLFADPDRLQRTLLRVFQQTVSVMEEDPEK